MDSGYNSICSDTDTSIRSSTPKNNQAQKIDSGRAKPEPTQSPVVNIRRDLFQCSTPGAKTQAPQVILTIKRLHLNEKSLSSSDKQSLRELYNSADNEY